MFYVSPERVSARESFGECSRARAWRCRGGRGALRQPSGPDFRPEVHGPRRAALVCAREEIALTETARPRCSRIESGLGLRDRSSVRGGVDRPNLAFASARAATRTEARLAALGRARGGRDCADRRGMGRAIRILTARARSRGVRRERAAGDSRRGTYHRRGRTALAREPRAERVRGWPRARCRTNAFGMGSDPARKALIAHFTDARQRRGLLPGGWPAGATVQSAGVLVFGASDMRPAPARERSAGGCA